MCSWRIINYRYIFISPAKLPVVLAGLIMQPRQAPSGGRGTRMGSEPSGAAVGREGTFHHPSLKAACWGSLIPAELCTHLCDDLGIISRSQLSANSGGQCLTLLQPWLSLHEGSTFPFPVGITAALQKGCQSSWGGLQGPPGTRLQAPARASLLNGRPRPASPHPAAVLCNSKPPSPQDVSV